MIDFSTFEKEGAYLLITTDNWFYAADQKQYKGVWGKCFLRKTKDVFGFDPKNSTNWFVQVGEGGGAVMIMGCQIHYIQVCDTKPNIQNVLNIES